MVHLRARRPILRASELRGGCWYCSFGFHESASQLIIGRVFAVSDKSRLASKGANQNLVENGTLVPYAQEVFLSVDFDMELITCCQEGTRTLRHTLGYPLVLPNGLVCIKEKARWVLTADLGIEPDHYTRYPYEDYCRNTSVWPYNHKHIRFLSEMQRRGKEGVVQYARLLERYGLGHPDFTQRALALP